MTVELRNPEYEKFIQEWQTIQDCCDGQRAIKEKNIRYLRPMEGVSSIDNRYRNYLNRAVFVNFTGKTREGLTGAIFRNTPDYELPSQTEYLEKNADGAGESLVSLAKDVTGEVIAKGRHALLVDYPQVTQGLSLEELNRLSPKATINRYTCENFINWRVEVINGQKLLTLAVLQETYDMNDDEFEYEEGKQYRVLRLRNGVYTQQLYQELEPITEEYIPRKSDGEAFDFIPLFIIGSENNDPTVDIPPLGDIAAINIAHYRNSADLEENCFVHGQLTLGVSSSMSLAQFQEANPEGIMVGSMAGHFLGESGGFSFVQASENQLADRLMERKEDQMRKLGARMISLTATKTATQSLIEAAGETSIMATISKNVSEGIEKCIEWCGMFMGASIEPKFALSSKFFDEVADPQMLMAAMQLNEAGILAKSDMQNLARSQGVVNELRLNEDIDADIEDESEPEEPENQEIAPNQQNSLTQEEDDDI
tara:strand:- start:19825 stop:21270 length:1446 start_codon:yes stop_codon:yes gene_type:complete